MSFLVLVRHGQSEWNKKNLFTGWMDVELSKKGESEAVKAGLKLKQQNLCFDIVFSSALKRAIHTMKLILSEMNLNHLPQIVSWRLNERHYGVLQGKNKHAMMKKYGVLQVQNWRRDFNTTPPSVLKSQNLFLQSSKKNSLQNKKSGSYASLLESAYKDLKRVPKSESLKDTQRRVLHFWRKVIFPEIKKQKSILIVAHGNSLRVLIKYLKNIPDEKTASIDIATGVPIVCKINTSGKLLWKKFG